MFQDYKDLLSALNAHGLEYLIVGGDTRGCCSRGSRTIYYTECSGEMCSMIETIAETERKVIDMLVACGDGPKFFQELALACRVPGEFFDVHSGTGFQAGLRRKVAGYCLTVRPAALKSSSVVSRRSVVTVCPSSKVTGLPNFWINSGSNKPKAMSLAMKK